MNGLTQKEALDLLESHGPNELPGSRSRTLFHIVIEVLREPMVYLLIGAGVIYFFLGDLHESLSLLGFLVLIIGITIYQEQKTERALAALRDLSSPRALVIRDGDRVRIPGREVVPGDWMILAEGDRVPADAKLVEASALAVNESLLTGESLPVDKQRDGTVYAGTTVIRGHALAEVFATGIATEIGKIGKSLEQPLEQISRLQNESRALVRKLAIYAGLLCFLVFAIYAVTRQDWLGGLLAGLTLGMAILPNELPAVLLIFFAAGAWRISRSRVLTRRLPAVETLGSTTVLCVDKTGTLTENRMEVRSIWNGSEEIDLQQCRGGALPEEFHEPLEYAVLASRRDPYDPMECAVQNAGVDQLSGTEHLHEKWRLWKEFPITDSLLAVSYAWRPGEQNEYVVAAKGAPEAIVDLCHVEGSAILRKAASMANRGLRVLGVARSTCAPPLPLHQHDFEFEFLGLVGFADPVRPDVPAAVAECKTAGIRVVMITGDHPDTARSIAQQVGLSDPDRVLTGSQVDSLDDRALGKAVSGTHVFSRMRPDQKLRLVKALQARSEVVGMTGDGVNDAPALKNADIGIAMGRRGTDVAREAASLVLLDDDFSSIVTAIRMGRRVFLNMQHAIGYLFAVHVPITLISIVPVVFNLPLVLLPLHIAFLHLVIEPACTLVFETELETPDLMTMPPRSPVQRLFGARIFRRSVLQGLAVTFAVLAVFVISLKRGQGELDARALTFTTLLVANLGLIHINRARRSDANRAYRWIVGGSIALLAIVLYAPPARDVFQFSTLHLVDLLICFGVAGLGVVLAQILSRRS